MLTTSRQTIILVFLTRIKWSHPDPDTREAMPRKTPSRSFVEQVQEQVRFLRDPGYTYRTLFVYVAGVPEPWEFSSADEFEFHEQAGTLIVRQGPSDAD